MADTNLRQADAKVVVEGYVSEKDLNIVRGDDGINSIRGSLTVKTSEDNFVRFSVICKEKTNRGTENKAYAGLVTVMNEYKSIADVGAEEADYIRVTGDVNPYRGKNGGEFVGYRSNFFNRINNRENANPRAEFSIELFISGIRPEVDKEGMETGRVIVKGWLPTFNGIEPIELVAPEDDNIADAVSSVFAPQQTVCFYGDVVNNRVEVTKEIPVAIGKPKIEKTVSFKNELVITGASEAYAEGITEKAPYNPAVINAAIQERQNKIDAEKASGNVGASSKPSAASRGRKLTMSAGF